VQQHFATKNAGISAFSDSLRKRRFPQRHQLETRRPLGRKFSNAPGPWRRRRSLSYAAGADP
jgi:hypothetical protein